MTTSVAIFLLTIYLHLIWCSARCPCLQEVSVKSNALQGRASLVTLGFALMTCLLFAFALSRESDSRSLAGLIFGFLLALITLVLWISKAKVSPEEPSRRDVFRDKER